MNVSTPHYLLFSEANAPSESGRWRFLLRTADGSEQFEASDIEPEVRGERLALLTLVRALETLDQPSQVTLVSCNTYVRRGMQYGLSEWRDNGWRWEFFGQMVPVKNGDLWQRLDRTLRFHRVECRHRRFDPPHQRPATADVTWAKQDEKDITTDGDFGIRTGLRGWLRYRILRVWTGLQRGIAIRGHSRWDRPTPAPVARIPRPSGWIRRWISENRSSFDTRKAAAVE